MSSLSHSLFVSSEAKANPKEEEEEGNTQETGAGGCGEQKGKKKQQIACIFTSDVVPMMAKSMVYPKRSLVQTKEEEDGMDTWTKYIRSGC